MLASGAEPPASVTNFFQLSLCQNFIGTDRHPGSRMEAAHCLKSKEVIAEEEKNIWSTPDHVSGVNIMTSV